MIDLNNITGEILRYYNTTASTIHTELFLAKSIQITNTDVQFSVPETVANKDLIRYYCHYSIFDNGLVIYN